MTVLSELQDASKPARIEGSSSSSTVPGGTSSSSRFKTLAIDSAGDLARLAFSFDMKKHTSLDIKKEVIRAVNNYPGAVERMNMIVRRLKNFRAAGMEIVITAHEDVERFFAKSTGGMGLKEEPFVTKGWADLPGKRAPDEFGRACDNMLHVRRASGKLQWVAIPELIGPGAGEWCVKDRFNAPAIQNGYLPPSYTDIAELAKRNPLCNWKPPYIWLIYGAMGLKKTRSLLTFPQPIRIFDTDRGTGVLTDKEKEVCDIIEYDPEESDDYNRFLADLEACMP